jgi:hypothetical protein
VLHEQAAGILLQANRSAVSAACNSPIDKLDIARVLEEPHFEAAAGAAPLYD